MVSHTHGDVNIITRMQTYDTPQYQDNGQWEAQYRQRAALLETGKVRPMKIPMERPESHNVRLAQAGFTPQTTNMNFRGVNLDSLPSTQQFAQQYGMQQQQDVPLNQIFGNNRPQQQHQLPPQYQQQQAPQQPQGQRCFIAQGATVYNPLRLQGFMEGGPVILCRQAGQANEREALVEYVVKGLKSCYVVPLNENRVDLARINNSPNTWTQMVEIQGAMGQSFLVPQQSLRAGQNPGRTMLRDQRVPQQQLYQQPMLRDQRQPQGQSRILRG